MKLKSYLEMLSRNESLFPIDSLHTGQSKDAGMIPVITPSGKNKKVLVDDELVEDDFFEGMDKDSKEMIEDNEAKDFENMKKKYDVVILIKTKNGDVSKEKILKLVKDQLDSK